MSRKQAEAIEAIIELAQKERRAINSHDALVKALLEIRGELCGISSLELTHAEKRILKYCEAALKQAKGE